MDMESPATNLPEEFKTLLERMFVDVRTKAYLLGWSDAMAAVKKVADAAPPKPRMIATVEIAVAPRGTPASYTISADVPIPDNRPGRIMAALKAKPGMTTSEIIDAAEGGDRKTLASVRTTLHRMKKKFKSVMNREGKWYAIDDYKKMKEMELF